MTLEEFGIDPETIKHPRCQRCGLDPVKSVDHFAQGPWHDACIANLPGVASACCGHGEREGYIKAIDGPFISFPKETTAAQIKQLAEDGLAGVSKIAGAYYFYRTPV